MTREQILEKTTYIYKILFLHFYVNKHFSL
jgi:hypothetical protein